MDADFTWPTQEFVETHKAGRITVLATTGTKRSPVLTDVPTSIEAGYALQGEVWFGVHAPGKTPPDVVARLNNVIVAAVQAPQLRSRMQALGMRPTGTSSAELAKIVGGLGAVGTGCESRGGSNLISDPGFERNCVLITQAL